MQQRIQPETSAPFVHPATLTRHRALIFLVLKPHASASSRQAGASKSPLAAMRSVLQNEGWRGLWRGNTLNCIRIFPNKGVLLSCSDLYRDNLRAVASNTFVL
eukprot:6178557-Pleurochrysis_carterae.AAC.2